jgi:hypothetical protein
MRCVWSKFGRESVQTIEGNDWVVGVVIMEDLQVKCRVRGAVVRDFGHPL